MVKREFGIVFSFVLIWGIHMMLNACVYIDIWSNASSIYLLWQMQIQQGTHPKELKKKRSNNLQCWITSDHVLNVKEKSRNVCSCKNIPALSSAVQLVLSSPLCVQVSDYCFFQWCSVCIMSYHFCILGKKKWDFEFMPLTGGHSTTYPF